VWKKANVRAYFHSLRASVAHDTLRGEWCFGATTQHRPERILALPSQQICEKRQWSDEKIVGRTIPLMEARRAPRTLKHTVTCGLVCFFVGLSACAPTITQMTQSEGRPGTVVSLSMQYLVGWPRVEIGAEMMDWPQLTLLAANPERKDIPGEDLIWIEDKILQFTVPDIPPGQYKVTIHDDKGPPGDLVYSALETTAYMLFPPVWPFLFRANYAQFDFTVIER
jgi:hypothetical protein